ncbi:Clc-like protein, partial [Oesophagostomum dentatum]
MFFLPPLQCVYKFDYYIDPEDLYDHNHDENRIRLAILSTIGVTVFYAWANYQDNKVIKEEEDTIYEQMLGWAFYCQLVAIVLCWLASMLGCCVTSVSFSKSRAKLVKIEVVEGDDDSHLLSGRNSSQPFKRSFSVGIFPEAIYRVDSQSLQQWERDYMRNAKERQQRQEEEVISPLPLVTNAGQTKNLVVKRTFKRTASMPAYSKKQRAAAQKKLAGRSGQELFSSTSNITETTHTGSFNTLERNQSRSISTQPPPPTIPSPHPTGPPKLKSALKTPQQSRKSVNIDDSDITYEYLPYDDVSMGVSSLSGARSQRTYDPIYEQIGQEAYLEPDSVRRSNLALNVEPKRKALPAIQPPHGSSQSVPAAQPKSTLIDDIARPSSSTELLKTRFSQPIVPSTPKRSLEEVKLKEAYQRIDDVPVKEKSPTKSTSFPATPHPNSKPSLSIRDFGIDLTPKRGYCDVETAFGSQDCTSSSSTKIKYADLSAAKSTAVPSALSAPSPLRYISVEKATSKRLDELAGRISTPL